MPKNSNPPPETPQTFEATLGSGGRVIKGAPLTEAQAVARRKLGLDIVVCGDDVKITRETAKRIEAAASGQWQRHIPHVKEGPWALPHFQPYRRPPQGHSFYETEKRKSF